MATSMKDGSRIVNPFTSLGKEFLKELQLIVQKILIERGGERDSDLLDSVAFTTENSRVSLYMYVNSYYSFVSKGRKPKVRKVPIYALIQWIKKKKITSSKHSINQLAFAIQNSIYKQGIRGKNFIKMVEESVLDAVEVKVTDELAESIADSLLFYFTKDVPFAKGR